MCQHLQARQERKAAYEVTSQDVTKWQSMVKVSQSQMHFHFSLMRHASWHCEMLCPIVR